jgi:hypothetical protein
VIPAAGGHRLSITRALGLQGRSFLWSTFVCLAVSRVLPSPLTQKGSRISHVSGCIENGMTVRKQKPLYASNRALVAFGLAICACLIAIYSWSVHLRSQREEWAQEEIPVSEFRTVLTQVREGMRGTAVVYQAEAHVSYAAGERHYSPWLPILQPSGSKQFLQLEIINLRKKPCRVHWDQKQPDHAFLTCEGAIQLP